MTANQSETTSPDAKSVELTRLRKARYLATNQRGGTLEIGEGDDATFSPVELLLAALAACTAGALHPVTCEWTPDGLVPLTVHLADRHVDLGRVADDSFVGAA